MWIPDSDKPDEQLVRLSKKFAKLSIKALGGNATLEETYRKLTAGLSQIPSCIKVTTRNSSLDNTEIKLFLVDPEEADILDNFGLLGQEQKQIVNNIAIYWREVDLVKMYDLIRNPALKKPEGVT